MADLIDIAPVTETVEVRGNKVEARGIKLGAAAELMQRFPELWKMLSTGGKSGHLTDASVAAIIAAGIAEIDEAGAGNLEMDEQMDLVGTIWGLTMRRGVDPFMQALTRFVGRLSAPPSAPKGAVKATPAKNSPKSSKP